RNLRRLIQKELEDTIANLIIDNYERNIRHVHAGLEREKIVVSIIETATALLESVVRGDQQGE
ncbi:hypothetical protein LJC34_07785, partial [Oscillospiraceae bacterium OttesenSCG-928-G22]|nr:hypothetical protein [Oscillospiraceae bacterium OttesenSCG-928-G22]